MVDRSCVHLAALAAAAVAALPLASVAAVAQEKVLNVYNWSDYIDDSVLADFTAKTGIKVNYDVYDSNDILETKLLAGKTGYDVVVPTDRYLARQIAAGVYQKLDKSKLPNISHMWPAVMERVAAFDPGNEYSVNYMWGTTGIGYNVEKVKAALGDDAPTDSWALVFDPKYAEKLAGCGITFLDGGDEILPPALNYLGFSPNSTDPTELGKAADLVKAVKPYVQKFHSSEYINALANGNVCVSIGWSGDVFQAQARAEEAKNGVEIAYSIPKEGAAMWFDQLAIPADAPHPEEALAFINYMMDPEVIAKCTNYVWYANGNKDSQPLIDKEILDDPAIYPPAEVMDKLFVVKAYGPKDQRLVNRLWTEIKSGS